MEKKTIEREVTLTEDDIFKMGFEVDGEEPVYYFLYLSCWGSKLTIKRWRDKGPFVQILLDDIGNETIITNQLGEGIYDIKELVEIIGMYGREVGNKEVYDQFKNICDGSLKLHKV